MTASDSLGLISFQPLFQHCGPKLNFLKWLLEISLEFGGPTSGSHRKDKQTVLTPSIIGARLPEIITVQPSDVLVPTNGLGEWVAGGMG